VGRSRVGSRATTWWTRVSSSFITGHSSATPTSPGLRQAWRRGCIKNGVGAIDGSDSSQLAGRSDCRQDPGTPRTPSDGRHYIQGSGLGLGEGQWRALGVPTVRIEIKFMYDSSCLATGPSRITGSARCVSDVPRRQSALNYFAAGWWNHERGDRASGFIMNPSRQAPKVSGCRAPSATAVGEGSCSGS